MPERPAAPPVGLCDTCRHQQVVRTTRGSAFSLCRRSRDEPDRFPRYPRLPVLRCPGYAERPGGPVDPGPGPGNSSPSGRGPGPATEGEAD